MIILRPRVGHIQFINCFPLFYGLIEKKFLLEVDLIKGNPKYGRDMMNALEIIDYNGRKTFNIPFSDPIVSTKFQELLLSMFKNSITKQYINGASCILVSNFGFTNEL